jgi:hypothetical protein
MDRVHTWSKSMYWKLFQASRVLVAVRSGRKMDKYRVNTPGDS